MANISIVSMSHDYCPQRKDFEEWAEGFRLYMQSGDKGYLPSGVQLIEMHHSADPSIIAKMLKALDTAVNTLDNYDSAKFPELVSLVNYLEEVKDEVSKKVE